MSKVEPAWLPLVVTIQAQLTLHYALQIERCLSRMRIIFRLKQKINMAATRFGNVPGMAANMPAVQQQMMSQRPQQYTQSHYQTVRYFQRNKVVGFWAKNRRQDRIAMDNQK